MPILDKVRAMETIEFMQMLRLTDDFYGQPFVLQDWQHEILWDVYGTVNDQGLRQYRYGYLEIAKKNAKALALDTPIPTPVGWKIMEELEIGDFVFGDDGKPCRIIETSEIMRSHDCFEVIFSDGSSIVADAGHLWETSTYVPWNKTQIHTTQEIKDTLNYQKGKNHKIKLCKSVEYPEQDLPIKPYTFGVWLGDGASHGCRITCHEDDLEIMQYVAEEGYPVKPTQYKEKTGGFAITDGVVSRSKKCFHKDIKQLGVFGNKHIPKIYLRASISQRFELLKGLMDTDGTISKAGQCSFATKSQKLADGIFELLASLGFKPTIQQRNAILNGKNYGTAYRIDFLAYKTNPVFKLRRKLERQKAEPKSLTRTSFRKIVEVRPVDSVPVKCIAVENDSRLYLAGKSFIPTHNTTTIAGLALKHLALDPPGGQIYCCAADREQAGLVYHAAIQMIEQDEDLEALLKVTDSKKLIINRKTGTFLKVLSAEAFTKHGVNPTVVIFDELHAQPNRELWDVMTFGAGAARREPLWWVITTAGDDPDRNSIGWEVHEYARKVRDGEIDDPFWYVKIYSAPEDADIFDERNWHLANPSLGVTINIESVRQEAIGARNDLAKERLFRWLRLNQWVAVKQIGWLPLTLWDQTNGKWELSELVGKTCYAGLDLSSTIDLTAVSLVFPPQEGIPDWRVIFEAWIPEDNMKERVRRDHVSYDRWVAQKYLHVTPGNVVDYEFVEARLLALSRQYDIKILGSDPWNSRMLTQRLTREGMEIVEVPQNMANMSPAMKEIERLMKAGAMTHEINTLARWCWGNVNVAVDGNGNIKPMKNKSADRIDVTVAMINAMVLVVRMEEKESIYDKRGMLFL